VASGDCQCSHFVRHRMTKGPCEHMLALRLAATPDMQGMLDMAGAATKTTTDQERTARIG
jgi:predicted nucleic acid-binding Zn finger protein